MNVFAIYNIETGFLRGIVRCDESLVECQLQDGEAALLAVEGISDLTHMVENGLLIELPPAPSPAPIPMSPPPPTESQVRALLVSAAQRLLDSKAREWGYDDMRSAVSYVGDPYPRFAAEGLALRNWRSAVWAYLDAAGAQPLPDPVPTMEAFVALLPAIPTRPV